MAPDSPVPPLDLEARFAHIAALKENWDSYGAGPISPAALAAARAFLDDAQVVPCSSGGVQLEWHTLGGDVELQFNPDGTADFFASNVSDRDELAEAQAALRDACQRVTDYEKECENHVSTIEIWIAKTANAEAALAAAVEREKGYREALAAVKQHDGEDGKPCYCDESPTGDNAEKRGIWEHEVKCLNARAALSPTPPEAQP